MRRAVLCFLQKDNTILLLHTQYPDKLIWNGVSGYIDEGEASVDAACRGIYEEIGVIVKSDELFYVGTYEPFDIYQIKHWAGEPMPKEESIKELEWFPIDALPYDEMHPGNESWLPPYIITFGG